MAFKQTGKFNKLELQETFYYFLPKYARTDLDRLNNVRSHLHPPQDPAEVVKYSDKEQPFVQVPAEPRWETDLATVPGLLWGLNASYGRQTLPALMHDRLCDLAHAKCDEKPPRTREAYQDRQLADQLFLHGLRTMQVDTFRRYVFWSGVTFGRYKRFRKPTAVVMLALALLASLVFYTGLTGWMPLRFNPVSWTTSRLGHLVVGWLPSWIPLPHLPSAKEMPHPGAGAGLNGFVTFAWGFAGWLGLTIAPLLAALVFRHEKQWALIIVGAIVGVPVVTALIVNLVVALVVRWLPWAAMEGPRRVWGVLPWNDLKDPPYPMPPILWPTTLK